MLKISEKQKTLGRHFREAFNALDHEDARLRRVGTPEAYTQSRQLRDQFVSPAPDASQLTDYQKFLVSAFKEAQEMMGTEEKRLETIIAAHGPHSPKALEPAFQIGYLAHVKRSLNAA